jgi:SAM-dependent methyltransferase
MDGGLLTLDSVEAVVSSAAMEGATNYFRWQLEVLGEHAGPRVLEVGCGAGGFTRALLGRERVVSVDSNPRVIERLRLLLADQREWRGVVADLTDPGFPEAAREYGCDSLTALNVLEHIEDDAAALAALRETLPTGGTAAVLVPAHHGLYSRFDADAGHFRRYTRRELEEKLVRAGFAVDRVSYFNMAGAVGWLCVYRLGGLRGAGGTTRSLVGFFDRFLVPAARRLELLVTPPFGISVVGLATAR